MASRPNPDDVYYDEDSGLFIDSESGDAYYDEDCTDFCINIYPD